MRQVKQGYLAVVLLLMMMALCSDNAVAKGNTIIWQGTVQVAQITESDFTDNEIGIDARNEPDIGHVLFEPFSKERIVWN